MPGESGNTKKIIEFEKDQDEKPVAVFNNKALDEALEGFENVPILVICVTGEFRSGKSFLLNLLVTYLNHLNKVSKTTLAKKPILIICPKRVN